MARVVFTANLRPYTRGVAEMEAEGARVCDLLLAIEAEIQGLRHYLVDDQGALRRHVNVFIDGAMVRDRRGLTDPLRPASEVLIMQAISGG